MQQLNIFHNTIGLAGAELQAAIDQCVKQEERILLILKGSARPLTRYEVYDIYCELFTGNVPASSIGRALSNLAKVGSIVKINDMVVERYGKNNHKWAINSQTQSN